MRKHSMQNILIFVIFCIFAILSLILVVVGVKFYDNISELSSDNTQTRNTCAYLKNKIRSNDRENQISVIDLNGTKVLLLDNESNMNYKTAIFVKDGSLKECLVDPGNIDISYADEIAKADDMMVDLSKNEINIDITCNGETRHINQNLQTSSVV